ncbi:MAG: hypothetical protein IJW36_01370 [Clostridia bacterium]|nr:hypothetical protein [Clostridia bacterium]
MKKKKKERIPELKLGTKIRDVNTNQKQHFLLFVAMMLLFNMMLLFSVWFVLIILNTWYNWVICFALIFICWGLSFRTYRNIKNFHKCELYDNALVINSIWFNLQVDLKNICEIKVKVSVLDKIFKLNTKSLEIHMVASRRKKFTIHFIEEDAEKLKWEILKLVEDKPDIVIASNDEKK